MIASLENRLEVASKIIEGILDDLGELRLPVACIAQGTLIVCISALQTATEQLRGLSPLVDNLTPHERAVVALEFAGEPQTPGPVLQPHGSLRDALAKASKR